MEEISLLFSENRGNTAMNKLSCLKPLKNVLSWIHNIVDYRQTWTLLTFIYVEFFLKTRAWTIEMRHQAD